MHLPDSPYSDLLASAYRAFSSDVSYAVAIAKQASALQKKRAVWSLRMELRAAEKQARAQCAASAPFSCKVQSPCGTGDCLFSSGDLSKLVVPLTEIDIDKPHGGTAYNIEAAVGPLRALREDL